MADEIILKRIKDAAKTLTVQQALQSYLLGDNSADGTGRFLLSDFFDYLKTCKDIEIVADGDTVTGAGTADSPLGLANPLWFVKGNTVYGGTIVDNLNTLVHNGWSTCYGSAVGAPDTDHSWFVNHQNSNAGTAYAVQVAYAYSTSVICYERIKYNGTWQVWTLRGSGSSSATLKYDNSMDCLAATENVAWQIGSDSNWSAHAALWKPKSDMVPVVGASTINAILPQPISGKSYIFAAYKYNSSGTHNLICSTDVNTMPPSSSIVSPVITRKLLNLVGGQATYFVAFTNSNGALLCGKTGQNLNITPYLAAIKTNLGNITAAPDTLSFESETGLRLFMSVSI